MLKLDILLTCAGVNSSFSWITNTSSPTDTSSANLKNAIFQSTSK